MSNQIFNKDEIWGKISTDPRFPVKETRRKNPFWLRLSILLLLIIGIFTYFSVFERENISLNHNQLNKVDQNAAFIDLTNDQTAIEKKLVNPPNNKSESKSINNNYSLKSIVNKNQGVQVTEKNNHFQLTSNAPHNRDDKRIFEAPPTVMIQREEKSVFTKKDSDFNKRKNSNSSSTTILCPNITKEDNISKTKLNTSIFLQISKLQSPSLLLFNLRSSKVKLFKKINIEKKKLKEIKNSPFYIDFAGGFGIPDFNTQPDRKNLIPPINSLQFNNYTKSSHLRLGLGYRLKQWEFEGGINLDIYKSHRDSVTTEIEYLVNDTTNKIEKYQITNSYLLFQYFGNVMVNLSAARNFRFGKLNVGPKVKLRYAVLNLSRGSLLGEKSEIHPIDGNVIIDNHFSIEMGVKFSFKHNTHIRTYLELGHSRNLSYFIEDQGYLYLGSTHINVGVNYEL